jgi:large subunit ribosomal protein L17
MEKTPHALLPKLFGPLRERYADRPGGYTRVLRIEPLKSDQAPSAILELVDGPKDMRFAMTARTVARLKGEGRPVNEMTERNIEKVTRYRQNGQQELTKMVKKMRGITIQGRDDAVTHPWMRPRDPIEKDENKK